jgi:protoporphyrinogen/coproporphyrinogen III oxidase
MFAVGYKEKVVVVGAGISGLVCAYRLKQLGIHCLVLEAKERAGGLIATVRRNGFLFETGPQCPRFPAAVWRLVREINLESEFVSGTPGAKRYLFSRGRLHPAPFSPTELITTRLVGFSSKFRILTEAFRYSQPPAHEESLSEFVERKFGPDVLDNLVDPFVSTIFLGDSHKMGMESAFPALVQWERDQGSLVRGAIRARRSMRGAQTSDGFPADSRPNRKGGTLYVTQALPSLGSFRSGMARLPERLSEELRAEIRYRTRIASVAPFLGDNGTSKAGWQICLSGGEKITAEHLILAVPAYVAAGLLEISVPQLASHLKAIEYAPICAVSSAYDRIRVANNLDGFGFMVPRREGLNTICTFWNSSLFGERAPRGQVLMTSFAGRELGHPFGATSEEECAQVVEAENARILGITAKPVDHQIWKDPQALPQYNVGHGRRVVEISTILSTHPNLYIAGNFLRGRSIGDCVEIASRVAKDLHSQLERQCI